MRVLAINHERNAGPGVFAEAIAATGGVLDQWFRAETDFPPGDPADYDAVMTFGGAMHVDQQQAHPWIAGERALLAELLERGTPLLAVCLGAQLLSEAAGGDARRAREPEIGWLEVEVTPARDLRPVDRPAGAALRGLRMAQLSVRSARGGDRPRAHPGLRPGLPHRRGGMGNPVSRRGQPHRRAERIAGAGSDPDAVRIGVDSERLRAATLPRMNDWNALGRELCERFLAVAVSATRPSSATSSSSH